MNIKLTETLNERPAYTFIYIQLIALFFEQIDRFVVAAAKVGISLFSLDIQSHGIRFRISAFDYDIHFFVKVDAFALSFLDKIVEKIDAFVAGNGCGKG